MAQEIDEKNQANNDEANNDGKPKVFFVLGGPGAGKGTQCGKLVDEFGIVHLSAGDLLRKERNSGSKVAKEINEHIKNGSIVPVEITVGLIRKAIEYNMKLGKYTFILDGFPRNEDNLTGWKKLMNPFADMPFLLTLECPFDELKKRILARAASANSNTQRVDDNEKTLTKRMKVFEEQTLPIINIFKKESKCNIISSIGTIDQVYSKVRKLFLPHLSKAKVIFVLGGPGSGKGTQCEKLVNEFGFVHLSAGDLLRKERNSGSKVATEINEHIKNGTIVPVKITVGLIKNAIEQNITENGKNIFIIDGFPRNEDNYNGWNKYISNIENPFLLYLDCSQETMQNRILNRAKECVKNGGKARIDDNIDALKKRFDTYKSQTQPIIEIFKKHNKCYSINANNGTINEIYNNVKKPFYSLMKKPNVIFVLGGPGSGKGTQCAKLVNEFGCVHLSAGDLLRKERNSGSDVANIINEHIKGGSIVPVKITVGLIKDAMFKHMMNGKFLFIIDGFPRNYDNLSGWNKLMGDFAIVPFLLFFKCNENEMTKRILSRAEIAKKNGEPVRKDDNAETLKNRFGVFTNGTMPVVNEFEIEGKCKKVDAMRTIDDVYKDVKAIFEPVFKLVQ